MDDYSIKWLFVFSTVIGFASAIVLSIDTIGLKLASRFIRKLRRGRDSAGAADRQGTGLPAIVIYVAILLCCAAIGALFWTGPAVVWRSLSFEVALAGYLGLAIAAWVLSLLIMVMAEFTIAGLRFIKWLHVRRYAGIIGFGLLAVSFGLQLIASLADALEAVPRH